MADEKKLDPILEKALKQITMANGDVSVIEDAKILMVVIRHYCEISGLNWETSPICIMQNQSKDGKIKETLYCTRAACAQLSVTHSLSVTITERKISDGMAIMGARVQDAKGRITDGTGVCSLQTLTGDRLANKVMHAETKAKRRAILDHCGLGLLDETEVAEIAGATTRVVSAPITTEIVPPEPAKPEAPQPPKPITGSPDMKPPEPLSQKTSTQPIPQQSTQATGSTTQTPTTGANPNYPGDVACNALATKSKSVWNTATLAKFLKDNYGITWSTRATTVTHENLALANAAIDAAIAAKK